MNKHFVYFLSFVFGLLMLPNTASAQYALSGTCGRRIQFNDDSTNLLWSVDTAQRVLTITGNGRMYDYDMDTKAPWYPWRNYIDRLVLPNGLTEIGTYAMYNLIQMDSIQWGGTIQLIRDYAFSGCSGLLSLSFPSSLIDVYQYAFSGCSNLRTLNTGDGAKTIGSYAFQYCSNLDSLIIGNGLNSIYSYAFRYCRNLKTILTIGMNLTNIDSYAFESCGNIQAIDFGNSPVSIGYEAFYTSPSLKSLRGDRIKSIGGYAFYNCGSLVNLQLGDSLQTIGNRAFYYCYSLTSLRIPATLSSVNNSFGYAYVLDTITVDPANTTFNSNNNCNALMRTSDNTLVLGCRSTVVPSSTKIIGAYAFDGCIHLQSVSFPDGLTTISNYAFAVCSDLQSISLPVGLSSIGNYAFTRCSSLQSVSLPEGLQSVGSNAFESCSQLQTVYLPNSVTSIGCDAFYNCPSLTQPVYNNKLFAYLPTRYSGNYMVPDSIETVCCGAFRNCDSLVIVTFPTSLKSIKDNAFDNCDVLQTVSFPDSLSTIGSYAFRSCRELQSIQLPQQIKSVNAYTFSGCSKLQTALLSENLTSVGQYAFSDCVLLPSVIIPDRVTTIEHDAFSGCSALTSFTFPAKLNRLGSRVLSGCYSLSTIVWNVRSFSTIGTSYDRDPFYSIRNQISVFTFGDSVQVVPGSICSYMTNLSSISLGCSIDSIGENAFLGCNNIKSVNWNLRTCRDPKMYYDAPFYSLRDSITRFSFGDSVQHIPAYLCHSMSRLHQVHIPKNVSSVGDFAFRYLGVLDSISVDPANTHYDSRYGCNALMKTSTNLLMLGCYKTQIPTNTQGIDAYAFRNVRNLHTVTLPSSVTFIGKEAFNGCKDLKNLTLSNNIKTINDYAFQDCDSLYNVTLPDSLWFLGMRAFAKCSHIGAIALPEKMELMDQFVFSGCSSLRSITCNAPEPPVIQETTFTGTSCPIYVPCPSILDYHNAPVWHDFGTRVTGLFFNTLTARPNDYSFGRVYVQQQPDCEHNAIVEADPILGYKFVSWQDTLGNVISVNPLYEFYLDDDKTIIAFFIRDVDALENISMQSKIWVLEHDVMILSEHNTIATLYDLMGHEVDSAPVEVGVETSLHAPASGMYVVMLDNEETHKIIIK